MTESWGEMCVATMSFVHLHVHSNFSFLDGACPLDDLVAASADMPALAVTDHNGLYGAVRFYQLARAAGIKPIIGVELTLDDGHHLVLLARNRAGYSNLCRLVTEARLSAPRESPACPRAALERWRDNLIALSDCRRGEVCSRLRARDKPGALAAARRYRDLYGADNFFIELCADDDTQAARIEHAGLAAIANELGIGIVASNNVHYLTPDRARLQDVMVCIQSLTTVEETNDLRRGNDQAYLKSPAEMTRRFRHYPEAIANTLRIAERCDLDLGLGEYHFPYFPVPDGHTADSYLRQLCEQGARERYGVPNAAPLPDDVRRRLDHELNVIRQLGFPEYFLVVWDLVRHARSEGIRCSGRGSAADSLVAYVLGATEVDPIAQRLLFERFLNPERQGMPDVDIDFDSRRRDEVLEYLCERYGHDRVAMVATINTYNARSAIREIGKALGLPMEVMGAISQSFPHLPADRIRDAIASLPELRGLGLDNRLLDELFDLCEQIAGFPRHLSVHLGGIVVSREPLTDLVPLERAAKGLIVAQFDKDDLETLGLVKLDLLGLRNLAAIEETLRLLKESRGIELDIDHLPLDDEKTFQLLRSTKTVGVFQLESPGMRGLLSRLQPTCFQDIVANISLFRPGPMQADMITPFLARRHGEEPVSYLHPSLEPILRDTYGVILYQEQVLEIASVLGGLSLGEADQFRRAMTHDRSPEEMAKIRDIFLAGARRNGVADDIAQQVFERLAAFAAYGFCKAHAAAFGHIAYQTAYLKAHYPAEFFAAILSNQLMGFYPSEVIVQEAKHMGIEVRPVDVNYSRDRYTVEACDTGDGRAIRVALGQVAGISGAALRAIAAARCLFTSVIDFCRRTRLPRPMVENLIECGAFDSIEPSKRRALWQLEEYYRNGGRPAVEAVPQLALDLPAIDPGPTPMLPPDTLEEDAASQLGLMGMSLKCHPLYFCRETLCAEGVTASSDLPKVPDGRIVRVAGIVIARQRPPTKSGQTVIFITLEDETGLIEVTVFPRIYQRFGDVIFSHNALIVEGELQKNGRYGINIVARRAKGLVL